MLLIDSIKLAVELATKAVEKEFGIELDRSIPQNVDVFELEVSGNNNYNFQVNVDGLPSKTIELTASSKQDAITKLRSVLVRDFLVKVEHREKWIEAYDEANELISYFTINRKFTLRKLTEDEKQGKVETKE